MKTSKKSEPLPAGPLSHTLRVKLTTPPVSSRPLASTSTPRLGSLHLVELLRYAVIDVAGSAVGSTVSDAGLPSGRTSA